MNNGASSSSNPQQPAFSGGDGFDLDWKKIEDFVGSKTVIQIRSHAQKYFLKVQKNGTSAHVPPPRPKRKAAHPYPQKAPKPVLAPLQLSMNPLARTYPSSSDAMPSGKGVNPIEDDSRPSETTGIRSCNMSGFRDSHNTTPSSVMTKQGKEGPVVLHGIPNFAEVYSFIGNVFDPDSRKRHIIKLKEMDPISFETVLLLMRNLTVNLSNPDFEPIKQVLSSYEVCAKPIGVIGAE